MSVPAHAMDAMRRYVESSLQQTLSAAQAVASGGGNRDHVLFLDGQLLGAVGALAAIAPGLVAATAGAGLSPDAFAAACTRTVGIVLLTLAYLAQTGTGVQALARAFLLFWTLATMHLFHLITATGLASPIHYVLFLVGIAMALAHALAARIFTV